jgi:hypothetical protein
MAKATKRSTTDTTKPTAMVPLSEVRLVLNMLGHDTPRRLRGVPLLARGAYRKDVREAWGRPYMDFMNAISSLAMSRGTRNWPRLVNATRALKRIEARFHRLAKPADVKE